MFIKHKWQKCTMGSLYWRVLNNNVGNDSWMSWDVLVTVGKYHCLWVSVSSDFVREKLMIHTFSHLFRKHQVVSLKLVNALNCVLFFTQFYFLSNARQIGMHSSHCQTWLKINDRREIWIQKSNLNKKLYQTKTMLIDWWMCKFTCLVLIYDNGW